MKKALKFLDEHLEEFICVVTLAAMTAVIFIQIILRAISSFILLPMAWTEEIGRYLFVWAVYVGAAYATRKGAHQKVDLLPLFCGKTGKLIFNLIGNVGVLVFSAVMTYYTWQIVSDASVGFVQRAPATKLNMGIAYAGPAMGMTLCAFRSIQNSVLQVRGYLHERKTAGGDDK